MEQSILWAGDTPAALRFRCSAVTATKLQASNRVVELSTQFQAHILQGRSGSSPSPGRVENSDERESMRKIVLNRACVETEPTMQHNEYSVI